MGQAIWFVPDFEEWAIGSLDEIRTNWLGIAAAVDEDTDLFYEANDDWKYWDGEWKSINSGDIEIVTTGLCPKGLNYQYYKGHATRDSLQDIEGIDINECAVRCDSYRGNDRYFGAKVCGSFEYSASEQFCSLNYVSKPTTTNQHQDYVFCGK